MYRKLLKPILFAGLIVCVATLLAACEDDKAAEEETETTTSESTSSSSETSALSDAPTLDMELPESLTGGDSSSSALIGAAVDPNAAHGGPHCEFAGNGDDEPFQNGFHTTRFLVGAVATWMCISDFLIGEIATLPLPADGTIVDITDDEDPDGPTGIRITENSSTQTTLELFFADDTTTPGVFLSWNTADGTTEGRLVLASGFLDDGSDPEAPNAMRMDFTITSAARVADMFLAFPDTHPNLNGFRIQVTKDLDSTALPIFTALGRLDMSQQFDTTYETQFPGGTPPTLLLYTVSDANGNGGAIASFSGVGIGLDLSDALLGHLGYYLFTKDDKYVFDSLGDPVWINKSITSATFQNSTGGRTSNATNLDFVESVLGLATDYFDVTCANDGDNCTDFLNAVYTQSDDGWGYEKNFGADPGDWRTTIINAVTGPDYLQSICPDDVEPCTYDETDVFAQEFTPGS